LDPHYPLERLAFMLQDAQPLLVLTDRHSAGILPEGTWQVVTIDSEACRVPTMDIGAQGTYSGPDNLAYMIYTSGSTGKPKGVEVSHRSLLNLIKWHQTTFAVTPTDRATQMASTAFDAAVWEIWPHLTAGASLHILDENARSSPEVLCQWLISHEITISFVPTPLAEQLIALPWPEKTRLRLMLTGGDTLHVYPRAELPFVLVNNYGPTECTVVATSGAVLSTESASSLPPIGRPITNTDIFILDSHMRPVPAGTVGEIYIGGIGLARGYHNQPELTTDRFVRNPFSSAADGRLYRTGDLGCYLPDGQISFAGRQDDQIKIRGFRVEPSEIAIALNLHPAVQASVIVNRHGGTCEQQLTAYVITGQQQVTASELRNHLAKCVPAYMIPSLFVRIDSLPLSINGKVDRAALPPPTSTNLLRERSAAIPETATQKQLGKIISGLLNVNDIGCEENFFLLGGHSLLAMQLLAKIREVFDVQLTLPMLFQQPTIHGLATIVESIAAAKKG
jgi:amino acid adenylation domain-containing protein